MKTMIIKQLCVAVARPLCWLRATTFLSVLLLSAANGATLPMVSTVTGGPSQGRPLSYGYVDGDTKDLAQFHTPIGLALDSVGANGSGPRLYVADRDNNAIRKLDLDLNQTITFATNQINRINRP